jgi:16S rRNA (uracil1498-N3)-methyltransferase
MGVNSLPWYYISSLGNEGETVAFDGEEWHHCFHVMRMREGDHLILCNGKGLCMEGYLLYSSSKEGKVQLLRNVTEEFKNPRQYHVTIGMAPTKNMDRTEFAVEKLVELGIDEIFFLDCDHNERSHLRIDRIEKIIIAAAKQSRKIIFPVLHELTKPQKLIERKKQESEQIHILGCHLSDESKPLSENYFAGKNVLLMIGPEGGFSKNELELMSRHHVKFTHLGPFRLRVETAAVVACAGIHLINQSNNK